MPKKVRLTRKDFPHLRGVFREHGSFFSVVVTPSPSLKMSCVISKKVAPKASARNLIKRQVRAILREEVSGLADYVLMFQAKRDAATASYDELRKDIALIIKKIKVRHGA